MQAGCMRMLWDAWHAIWMQSSNQLLKPRAPTARDYHICRGTVLAFAGIRPRLVKAHLTTQRLDFRNTHNSNTPPKAVLSSWPWAAPPTISSHPGGSHLLLKTKALAVWDSRGAKRAERLILASSCESACFAKGRGLISVYPEGLIERRNCPSNSMKPQLEFPCQSLQLLLSPLSTTTLTWRELDKDRSTKLGPSRQRAAKVVYQRFRVEIRLLLETITPAHCIEETFHPRNMQQQLDQPVLKEASRLQPSNFVSLAR